MIVRVALPCDESWLLGAIRRFDAQTSFRNRLMPDDEDTILSMLRKVAAEHVLLVALNSVELKPVGFVAGIFTPHVMNPWRRCFYELLWWVEPEFRHSRAAWMLATVAKRMALERGAEWLWWTVPVNSPLKSESMSSLGFVERERQFLMEA